MQRETNVTTLRKSDSSSARSRAWFIMPVLAAGVLITCGVVLMDEPEPTETISQVKRQLRDIALHKSTNPSHDNGGPVGPWWIAATDADVSTGVFKNFQVQSGQMMIGAKSATLNVDIEHDTFSFELRDVVFTRVPKLSEENAESRVLTMESHTLGPAPYGVDIVPDTELLSKLTTDGQSPIVRLDQ